MRSSDSQAHISPALVAALAAIGGALKDSKNPHFRNDYASLESVIDSAKPVLAEHELAVLQGPGELHGNALTVTTRIVHTSGEWIESDLQIPLAKADPQAAGSAITYARRYGLMAMLGMPAVDDDAESAHGRDSAPQKAAVVVPSEPDWWGAEGPGPSAYSAKKDKLDLKHEDLRSELDRLATAGEWRDWCATNTPIIKTMPRQWRSILRAEAEARAKELGVDFNKRAA